MKQKTIYIAFLLLFTFACEDFVDVEPTHQEAISNGLVDMDDYEAATIGVHSALRANAYYGRTFGVLLDMMAEDIFETPESLGNQRAQTDWLYNSDDGEVAGFWLRAYQVILRANTVLVGIDDIEGDDGRRNRLKAQALGLRALAHFDLLRAFGESYERNSQTRGVPIKLDLSTESLARSTVEQVYDQIFSDLNEALTLFAAADAAVTERTFFSELATNALMARVALYAGMNDIAIQAATAVINDGSTGLISGADFSGAWINARSDAGSPAAREVIWEVAYTFGQDSRVGSSLYFVPNNRVAFRPSSLWTDLFDTPANDVRFTSYVREDARRGNVLIPSKYEPNQGFNNFKVFRMGEMYLIRAEARANNGDDANAMADLNTLRAARITGYVDENLTGNALANAIEIERRKELFVEGHRWFDIRRMGQGITRGPDFSAPAVTQSLPAGDFRFVWPIPIGELDANPNIKDDQNPGY